MSEAPSKESMELQPSDEGSAALAPALEAEHLLRAVVGKVITNNISVQVHVGEILAVTGPQRIREVVLPALAEPARRADGRYCTARWSGLPKVGARGTAAP